MLLNQTLLSFLVPSSSGLAVLAMPILAPLADFAGVARSLVVTAYQSANGWVNLFNPTFAVVMGGLAIGRVSYNRWLRFLWPLLRDPRDHRRGGAEPRGNELGSVRRPRRRPPKRRRTEAMEAGQARVEAGGGLGLVACTALVVGNMIGSGVFLLPASLAPFGPSLVGWGDLVGALLLALIFGWLARRVTRPAAPTPTPMPVRRFAGFMIAWGYWIAIWSGNAGVAVALAGYVGSVFPGVGASPARPRRGAGRVWTLTGSNPRRRRGRRVQVVTTVLKLVPLVLSAGSAVWVDGANFTPCITPASANIAAIPPRWR